METNAERHWEKWGAENPMFGVLSDPKFLNDNLDDQSLSEFFESGERHVDRVYRVTRTRLCDDFQPARVLDFGCGVGRLLIPFARRAQRVVGVDISRSMLEQAAKNCGQRGLKSVELLTSSELESLRPNSFDLVHSCIVFQHIPVAEGERIFQKLAGLISAGGVGAIHLTFSDSRPASRRFGSRLRERSSLMHGFLNLAQGKAFSAPHMQMNCYSMSRALEILANSRCSNLFVEFETQGAFLGAMLYFQKDQV